MLRGRGQRLAVLLGRVAAACNRNVGAPGASRGAAGTARGPRRGRRAAHPCCRAPAAWRPAAGGRPRPLTPFSPCPPAAPRSAAAARRVHATPALDPALPGGGAGAPPRRGAARAAGLADLGASLRAAGLSEPAAAAVSAQLPGWPSLSRDPEGFRRRVAALLSLLGGDAAAASAALAREPRLLTRVPAALRHEAAALRGLLGCDGPGLARLVAGAPQVRARGVAPQPTRAASGRGALTSASQPASRPCESRPLAAGPCHTHTAGADDPGRGGHGAAA
jgi:hypothetical protein